MNEAIRHTGRIDGRERRAAEPDPSYTREERAAYMAGYDEGVNTPMLRDKEGRRSIFDDVDL